MIHDVLKDDRPHQIVSVRCEMHVIVPDLLLLFEIRPMPRNHRIDIDAERSSSTGIMIFPGVFLDQFVQGVSIDVSRIVRLQSTGLTDRHHHEIRAVFVNQLIHLSQSVENHIWPNACAEVMNSTEKNHPTIKMSLSSGVI